MRTILLASACFASSIASAAAPIDGLYNSVFGGYTYQADNIYKSTLGLFRNGTRYNGGYNAGARLGYQSNPLRYEVEYTYLNANAKRFDVNYVRQNYVDGASIGNLFMANVYYDFPDMLPAISPFLGGGIGYSYLQVKLASNGPNAGVTYFNAHENAFAYQGTAGITYNFAENYAANLSYRFVATGKTSEFGRTFQSHIASAGAIYRFDYGNYK